MAMAGDASVNNDDILPKAVSYDQLFFTLQPPQPPKANIGDVDLLGSGDLLHREVYNTIHAFMYTVAVVVFFIYAMSYIQLLPPVKFY